jgi:hypothetical protein
VVDRQAPWPPQNRVVELDLGLRRQPADDHGDIAALEVWMVDLQLSARTPFTARVPRDDVVPGLAQRADADDVVRQKFVL